jgi:predicted short-subunit dehydrogenase-like oxidoreductase (DUF2520 family)
MNRTRRRQTAKVPDTDGIAQTGVAIVGVGAVGSSLARSLFRSGYRVACLVNRTLGPATDVASQTGTPVASTDLDDIPEGISLIFICTRDESIAGVAKSLAQTGMTFRQSVVAHVSGQRTSAELDPLRARGAYAISFHPLGSFPPGNLNKTFQGLTIGLEGDPFGVAIGRILARDLGAFPVEIPAEAKPAYHLAAVLTSNHLVGLMSDVGSILSTANLPVNLTHSLARDTLDNLLRSSPEQALTGPVVRGDHEALAKQVALLRAVAPDLLPRFLALAGGVLSLADRSGRINDQQREKLRGILKEAARS